MDQEVAKTLGELELKLQELERELTSIVHHEPRPHQPQPPSKLIDEAVERGDEDRSDVAQSDEQERAVDNAFGGPAVFGGEEVPAQGATIERDSAFPVSETAYGEIATGSSLPTPSFPSGVFAPAMPHTRQPGSPPSAGPPLPPPGPTPPPPVNPSGPPTWPPQPPSSDLSGSLTPPPAPTPQPPSPPQPIDRAELVRFKEKLQRTMEDLIDEYGKLLLPKPPA
jgi:hypothetical protein